MMFLEKIKYRNEIVSRARAHIHRVAKKGS